MRSIIPALCTLRNYVREETMRTVYFALVESILRYGIKAWRSGLNIIQKKYIGYKDEALV